MKYSLSALLVMLGILILVPDGLLAQPVAANSSVIWDATHDECSMILVPNGTGTPLWDCWARGGDPCSAAIRVELLDATMNPVAYWPNTSIRLTRTPPSSLAWCPASLYPPPDHAPNCADYDTDGNGLTSFKLAYHGGGWQDRKARVWVEESSGVWAMIPMDIPLYFNSPDINGDRVVDLADFVMFAGCYFGPYCYSIDYNFDGDNNILDLTLFATYGPFGTTCP